VRSLRAIRRPLAAIICRPPPIQPNVELRGELMLCACLYSIYCVIDVCTHAGIGVTNADAMITASFLWLLVESGDFRLS
jgi:hypothetical protein